MQSTHKFAGKRKRTWNCGDENAAVLCKTSLAVYELKLAWHGLFQPGSVQTVGLSRAILEDTLFMPWETISVLGLLLWLLIQL